MPDAPQHGSHKYPELETTVLCLLDMLSPSWFQDLCCHYGVTGQAYYLYKPVGKARTFGVKPETALERLKGSLADPSMALIYHCYNHYFCPIGFEVTPKKATDAYK